MSFRARLHGLSSPALVALAVAGAGLSAVVACRSTEDPRAGTRSGASSSGGASSSSGAGGSSSGGLDAAPPAGPVACGPAPVAGGPFTKGALLGAAADCAAWHACNFQNAATALRTSMHELQSVPAEEKRGAARLAWRAAMDAWSRMELFQFGPVAPRAVDPYHGRALRTFLHPWPDLNRCQVEGQIVGKAYAGGWDAVLPSARGLFAVEYTLHYPNADTACLPASATAQAWTALAPPDLVAAKDAYGAAVADNVLAVALEIRNVWAPEGENFKAKLLAFEGYGSEQEALNIVASSLLYVHTELKDLKIGTLAGVDPTPPSPETPFARVEVENVRTNLRAFRSLFQGCGADGSGIAFDDWLVAANHTALASDMLAALARAEAAADAFPPFATATQAQFLDLYNAIRPLSDLLKTSFFGSGSSLNLKLPASAASDTD